MNATSTTTAIQKLFGINIATFDAEMVASPIGAESMIMFPFLNGERMPNLPEAKGSMYGLTMKNFTRRNCIRAAAESVAFGLRWEGTIPELCKLHISLDEKKHTLPNKESVKNTKKFTALI
jgi:sugar (pentulose or hexulose) kinase